MLPSLCVLLLLTAFPAAKPQSIGPTTYFANSAVLGTGPTQPTLSWNYTATDITFKLVVTTTGWVGFGLSPNGGMLNSDIIFALPKADGSVEITDRHIDGSYKLLVDTVVNWRQLFFSQSNGLTTFIFTRKLKVCNPEQPPAEINIDVSPTSYVIYASGQVLNDRPVKHLSANRGSKSLPLLTANKKVSLDGVDVTLQDFKVNATLANGLDTHYYCTMFKLPAYLEKTKHHALRVETLLRPGQEKYVHHWTMNECTVQYETEYLRNNSNPTPGLCVSGGEWARVRSYCNKLTLVWATGGDLVTDFPANMGYPVGGDVNDFKYFFLEMHYENADNDKDVKDDSGIRLYLTRQLRPIEFGVFSVGALVSEASVSVPPLVKSLNIEYLCQSSAVDVRT
jgi:hypothetical protein